jgi:hypothetical protein
MNFFRKLTHIFLFNSVKGQNMKYFFILISLFEYSLSAETFKKISITSTNNTPSATSKEIESGYAGDISKLRKLRRYVERKGFKPEAELSDLEFIKKTMKWVTSQWKHNGWNAAPSSFTAIDILKKVHKKNEQYRCVEYGIVLSEVLQAYGFQARTIGMQSEDVAYGGFGRGHVASEIWSNELGKWIFFDPQFGVYLSNTSDGSPLSYYELFQKFKSIDSKSITVNMLVVPPNGFGAKDYMKFIIQYFGYLRVKVGENRISLGLKANQPAMTFQGMATSLALFTRKKADAYPKLNKVNLLLSYDYKLPNFNKIFGSLNGLDENKLQKAFDEKLPLIAAKPIYKVKPKSNIANLSHYEYRFNKDKKWIKLKKDYIKWNAKSSLNIISVRGVNTLGRSGPVTFIKLSYN